MTDSNSSDTPKPYSAVVYFHGMGSQRRYEETSRLIDALDSYLSKEYHDRGMKRGMLVGIKPRLEPLRGKPGETVTYIRTRHAIPGEQKSDWDAEEVRFYETYWAPIMAGSSSARRVALWIIRQSVRPWQTLRTVWRERQRLRRASLADLEENASAWPEGTETRDFDKLLRAYTDFEGLDAKRSFPTGKFAEFQNFIAEKNKRAPDTTRRLQDLAEAWRKHYRNTELSNAFYMLTILLALALTGGLLLWSLYQLLTLMSGLPFIEAHSGLIDPWLTPSVTTAINLAVGGLLFLGIGRFLTDYMGDVEAWSTYEETDEKNEKRNRVIAQGLDVLSHVLADERCKRVVIVAHSLGTSIAHDTILAMARSNRAVNASDPITGPIQLDKIQHFITMGSPIDKINYFFESYRTDFHRYTRVVETLRGDISDVPFSRNRHPYIHWVNYWDDADIISGGLHSPVGRKSLSVKVDNVHVSSLHFPNPGASHSAYFANRNVVSGLFDMIFLGKFSYQDVPLRKSGKGKDYGSVRLGPGEAIGKRRLFLKLTILTIWIGLLYLILTLTGFQTGSMAALIIMVLLVSGLAASWVILGKMGPRHPL